MSSQNLQGISSRRFQHVFNVTIFCLPRRLEGFLREDVLEDEKLIVTLKTCWRRVQVMSWRPANVCWGYKAIGCCYNVKDQLRRFISILLINSTIAFKKLTENSVFYWKNRLQLKTLEIFHLSEFGSSFLIFLHI